MAKLQYHPMEPRLTKEEIVLSLSGDYESHVKHGTLTYADIVREFKKSGKYSDFDYPGGIDKLVEDYEAGLLGAEDPVLLI